MSTKLKRTSMSLDLETIETLEYLSELMGTSKAEVIRRAVKEAHQAEKAKGSLTVQERLALLDHLEKNPMLTAAEIHEMETNIRKIREGFGKRNTPDQSKQAKQAS